MYVGAVICVCGVVLRAAAEVKMEANFSHVIRKVHGMVLLLHRARGGADKPHQLPLLHVHELVPPVLSHSLRGEVPPVFLSGVRGLPETHAHFHSIYSCC